MGLLLTYNAAGSRVLFHTTSLIPDSDAQLLSQQTDQARTVPEIDPVTTGTSLLASHVIALDDPIEPLGARYRAAEPDLLVRWLLVEDIGSSWGKSDV